MPRPAFFGIALLCFIVGCLDSLDERDQDLVTPLGTRSPIIQGLLDPRATVQTFWIEWSIPSDSAWEGQLRPINPTLVDLNLIAPDGAAIPLIPGAPAQFSAQIQVMPDSLYRLEGTIDDSAITATVRIPDSVHIANPASDTVSIAREGFTVPLPYEFTVRGATVFLLTDQSGFFYPLRSTKGVESIFGFEDTLRLTVDAYETYAGEWLDVNERPTASNVTGAYGYLGAFIRSRPIVVIVQ
jgi:hypothetical protein